MKLGNLMFTASDFKSLEISSHGAENCARIANAMLLAKLEKAPKVYSASGAMNKSCWFIDRRFGVDIDWQDEAVLLNIQPIDEQKDMRDADK